MSTANAGVVSGFDPGYYIRAAAKGGPAEGKETKQLGGYYTNAAQKGEPAGRWAGKGLEALGIEAASEVTEEVLLKVLAQEHPETGEQLGRAPRQYKSYVQILGPMLAREPEATAERVAELEKQAARECRSTPPYRDMTTTFVKSVSILHASIRESERLARLSGDVRGSEYWQAREAEFSEALQLANLAGLQQLQELGGYTRTGYHGKPVEGRNPGRYEKANLVVASFLQGSNRNGDCHDHIHNLIARMAETVSDGKWRTVDGIAVREALPDVASAMSTTIESELSRRFGVEWADREDGKGREIKGITREMIDEFSTRAQQVDAKTVENVRKEEARLGRELSEREVFVQRDKAWDQTRQGKDVGVIDMDRLYAKMNAKLGGALSAIAPQVSGMQGPGSGSEATEVRVPAARAQRDSMRMALQRVQATGSTWTRGGLMKEMSSCAATWTMPADDALRLVAEMTDRALRGEVGQVECHDAPEWPRLPDSLRASDGQSVYTRPNSTRYSTGVQISTEQRLVQSAAVRGGPQVEAGRSAEYLGTDAPTLEAHLLDRAEESREITLANGLRLDQAAALHHVLTSDRIAEVLTGAAGAGKSTVAAFCAEMWPELTGCPVVGVTPSQASRNVLANMGMQAHNFADFLGHLPGDRGARGAITLEPGSLIWIDEGSMLSTQDMADICRHAVDSGCKVVISGDQEQLTAVEGGGGMMLLARTQGSVQLGTPLRFSQDWERDASLQLRAGNVDVLQEYESHGRIRGGERQEVLDGVRREYVASYIKGDDTVCIAKSNALCAELSMQIRDDLIHLGYVNPENTTQLSNGSWFSRGDLLINTKNDYDAPVPIANGDTLKVVGVKGDKALVAKLVEDGDGKHFGEEFTYPTEKIVANCDLGYVITGHDSQGSTVDYAHPIIVGDEDRQWYYVAMSRGRHGNTTHVVTPVRQADPVPGVVASPSVARYEKAEREWSGIPEEPKTDKELKAEKALEDEGRIRDKIAVVSDVMERDGSQMSAIETHQKELSLADHLGILHVTLDGETKAVRDDRYAALVREVLPEKLHDAKSNTGTWLYRTLRQAENSGLDARTVLERAVSGRSFDGLRDHLAGLKSWIEKDNGAMVPVPRHGWSGTIEKTGDPDKDRYLAEVAQAMDERMERLGVYAAKTEPLWAARALGPVPEGDKEKGEWQDKAATISAYREVHGYSNEVDAIGPEPVNSPDAQQLWHTAFACLAPKEGFDPRGMSDGSLLNMRNSYKAETAWAPRYVDKELAQVRISADEHTTKTIRAEAESELARENKDLETARRHEEIAAHSRGAAKFQRDHEARLEAAQVSRVNWEQNVKYPLANALAADTEYRSRYPDAELEPLKSAEPAPLTPEERQELEPVDVEAYQAPAWLADVAERARQAEEKIADRESMQAPTDREDEFEDAWPARARDEREAILRPPVPDIPAAPEVTRLAAERAAGASPDLSGPEPTIEDFEVSA